MDDDLNTAQAIGHLFDIVRVLNQEVEQGGDPAVLRADRAVAEGTSWGPGAAGGRLRRADTGLGENVMKLLEERTAARTAKDWARADAIRAEVEQAGYAIEDTPMGRSLVG